MAKEYTNIYSDAEQISEYIHLPKFEEFLQDFLKSVAYP